MTHDRFRKRDAQHSTVEAQLLNRACFVCALYAYGHEPAHLRRRRAPWCVRLLSPPLSHRASPARSRAVRSMRRAAAPRRRAASSTARRGRSIPPPASATGPVARRASRASTGTRRRRPAYETPMRSIRPKRMPRRSGPCSRESNGRHYDPNRRWPVRAHGDW